ncbi:RIB43A-like with coiled-coils protein 1 [Eucyclogobius newberryi]|uniref:RIB43A-like with coiled-coils protein 1 n=1 Tax=Eucyclogobius newberryi TaxID=166745 RepID=UPI003B5A7D8D
MYKVDLPVDQSTRNAVERCKAVESARKERIFNPRLRVMGLDLQALQQQVQDRKHQQHLERQRDKAYDFLRLNQDEALVQQDNNEKQRHADLQSDLTKFWSTFQRVEDSRDVGPHSDLKGAVTLSVPESELGPASMQIFEGEDQGAEVRRKEQMKITERNLRTQKEDNERRRMAEQHKDTLTGLGLMYEGHRSAEMCELEEECRRASRIALDNYNHALATEQAERKREEHRREERMNLAEMWHTATSDMMMECAEAAERRPRGGRPPGVLTDRWKGMSPAQLSAIHKEREAQCEEKQKQQDKERGLRASFGLQLLRSSHAAEEEEQREAELMRQKRVEMDLNNRLLAKEQQTQQEYLDKILYTNKPTKDYFRQFNTSSR